MLHMTASADATPYALACVAYHNDFHGSGIPKEAMSSVTPEFVILRDGWGKTLIGIYIQKDGTIRHPLRGSALEEADRATRLTLKNHAPSDR